MDFFSAQKFFADMFPGKKIAFHFDKSCLRQLECVFTDGIPNVYHHVEFCKVKMDVEGEESKYVPIDSHRASISWASFYDVIMQVSDINVTGNFLTAFVTDTTDEQKAVSKADLMTLTRLSSEIIDGKIKQAQQEASSYKPVDSAPVDVNFSI